MSEAGRFFVALIVCAVAWTALITVGGYVFGLAGDAYTAFAMLGGIVVGMFLPMWWAVR